MTLRYVVNEEDVEGIRQEGDTALDKTITGIHTGSRLLEQRVTRYDPGRSLPREEQTRDELLYIVSGRGTLELDGEPHDLEPDSGVYGRAGETYVVENDGPDQLVVVSTTVPMKHVRRGPREVVVRFADQPVLRADAKRTFRYLVNEDAGCLDVTQFVGLIPPGRPGVHSHTYDEILYVVEGEGVLHMDGSSRPIRAGSCMHLPPLSEHAVENTGSGTMRVMGVFHPSGDPASRAYEET